MESKSTGKRRRRLKAVLSVAAALMMLATAPGLAAQETPGGFPAGAAPGVGFDPAQGPAGGAAGVCTHAPGEFLVGYASEEAFRAAPTGNVVGTFPEILAQHLALPEVAGDPAAEEAKRQELSAQPGVLYAEYNCAAQANQAAAPEAAPAPPPAICANCGKRVVEKVGKILDGGSGGSDAYGAALDAARATDGSVALASETEPGEEDPGSAGSAAPAATTTPDPARRSRPSPRQGPRTPGRAPKRAPPLAKQRRSPERTPPASIPNPSPRGTSRRAGFARRLAVHRLWSWARAPFSSRPASSWPAGPWGGRISTRPRASGTARTR